MMRRTILLLSCWSVGFLAAAAQAQPDNEAPPQIADITWQRVPFDQVVAIAFDPATDVAEEGDTLIATLLITDPDWGPLVEDPEGILYRVEIGDAGSAAFPSPEPPPFTGPNVTFPGFVPEEAIAPPANASDLMLGLAFTVPEFVGRNQGRLRGLLNFDVRYSFTFEVVNDEPDEGVPVFGTAIEFISVIENPAFRGPNPRAFADAGGDQVVVAGSIVTLDGSQTFDGFNIGFDPNDPNVFEKDDITFTWEWLSGPTRVDPSIPDPEDFPEIAQVTLTQVGTYVYRLLADDNANPEPTSDTVLIEVVSSIPENDAPRAAITSPTTTIVVGDIIRLDGTGSTDPNGDPLSFRWIQTDEVGQLLAVDLAREIFQPLGGIESPVSQWQAVTAGEFFFRLLVDDGQLSDTATVVVQVVEASGSSIDAGGGNAQARDDGSDANAGNDETGADAPAPAVGCGAGLGPALLAPMGLWFMRRRRP